MILKQHYYKEKTFLISSVVIIKACVSSKKKREKILPKNYLQYEQVVGFVFRSSRGPLTAWGPV